MIKIDNVEIAGWGPSIRGMRNPLESWDKSDSYAYYQAMDETEFQQCKEDGIIGKDAIFEDEEPWVFPDNSIFYNEYKLGNNDKKLMNNLALAGTDHSKFARMLTVWCDITAPLYWWKEFKTYRNGRKFADEEPDLIPCDYLEYDIEMNSCSTMHKIHSKEFTLDDFSHEHIIEPDSNLYLATLDVVIDTLNTARSLYIETKDKIYWWQMIQLLPTSYNQMRTVQLNYQVLWSMYKARKNHKLDEWHTFCDWVETLPYFKEIYLEG